mmetsp:Transcript_8049/g.17311  ORF Transcript_8049/g.17311 Transcript_8049/m.17311 type:complete len:222 (-) Transcript_8049:531-1196(-)
MRFFIDRHIGICRDCHRSCGKRVYLGACFVGPVRIASEKTQHEFFFRRQCLVDPRKHVVCIPHHIVCMKLNWFGNPTRPSFREGRNKALNQHSSPRRRHFVCAILEQHGASAKCSNAFSKKLSTGFVAATIINVNIKRSALCMNEPIQLFVCIFTLRCGHFKYLKASSLVSTAQQDPGIAMNSLQFSKSMQEFHADTTLERSILGLRQQEDTNKPSRELSP